MKSDLVKNWFGPQFALLHPLLQQLHEQGGRLRGPVTVRVGRGFTGWLGRRLAHKMGVPLGLGACQLQVDISHHGQQLRWARQFIAADGRAQIMVSHFDAVGQWPMGHWFEQTGALRFKLTVDVREGTWHWRVLGVTLHGIPVPALLLPRSHASKRIENDAYRFEVVFAAPLLGELLRYQGLLALQPED